MCLFTKTFDTGMLKLHANCPDDRFKLNKKVKKKFLFIIFGPWAGHFRPFGKTCRKRSSELYSASPIDPIVKKLFSGKQKETFIIIFRHGVINLWLLSKFSREGCQSCILLVHRKILGKKSFLKILMLFDQVRTLSKKVLAFAG